jgi:hypothetical protein
LRVNSCLFPVWDEEGGDETYDRLILDAVGLAPGGHDEGVVEGDHDDLVDALALELLELADEARDVCDLARGRESAGDGDDDDLLVLGLCVVVLRR